MLMHSCMHIYTVYVCVEWGGVECLVRACLRVRVCVHVMDDLG